MEKCIDKQLTVYLENNNLLSSRQFGFRKGKLTELAATLFFDHVHRAMDRGELTDTIFIDLSKAFDTVSHSVWLSKLSGYGICGREKEHFLTICLIDGNMSNTNPQYPQINLSILEFLKDASWVPCYLFFFSMMVNNNGYDAK